MLTVGSDVNQVNRPGREMGKGGRELQESADSVVVHGSLHIHLASRFHRDSQLCGWMKE